MRNIRAVVALALITTAICCWGQDRPDLNAYFKDHIHLSDSQVKAIQGGKAVSKTLRSRTPAEIFVFGAVYIYILATPDAYINFSTDFHRLRQIPGYIAVGRFSTPPQIADLDGFTFETDAKLPTVGDTDDLFYDPARRAIYVIGGERFTDVFRQRDPDHYDHIFRLKASAGTRTGLFVPLLSRLFVAAPHRGSKPARILVCRLD